MTCLKCGGLMVPEPVSDFFDRALLWRCVQCGLVIDWLVLKHQQVNVAKGVGMPRFTSEEHRRNWMESMRRKKALKQVQASVTQLPVRGKVASDDLRIHNAGTRETDVVAVLDRAIHRLDQDRQALERAKEILSR